ncbi:MAG: helix-turn-helix transcriptional regulator, partial [Deltaproteobacteria bacterium]|nr:helix-turn-helix transcriptional regulator [Deltaproteobacteria bacterium]
MHEQPSRTHDIPTQVKNPALVDRRRRQIVEAAAKLFIAQGFHKTTTRQIARAAGFSIGSLYEYVTSKEDVLYLVCEFIHTEVARGVAGAMQRTTGGKEVLVEVIR